MSPALMVPGRSIQRHQPAAVPGGRHEGEVEPRPVRNMLGDAASGVTAGVVLVLHREAGLCRGNAAEFRAAAE